MSSAHRIITNITVLDVGTPPSSSGQKWETFKLSFHRFEDLSSTRGLIISSPVFESNGRKWYVRVYPGGNSDASEGYVSVYLVKSSGGTCTVEFDTAFENVHGGIDKASMGRCGTYQFNKGKAYGWRNFVKRSDIFDESRHLLDRNGTLVVVVSMNVKEKHSGVRVQQFVPRNDFISAMRGLLFDEDTADACFHVGTAEGDEGNTAIHAHRLVLRQCAPMFATLFDSFDTLDGIEMATVNITDVRPEVFRLLLAYVYGRSLPKNDMKIHAKDIINAAEKYALVNLKLVAEVAYVNSTTITLENVIDNLFYADSKNLALLKEAVMDFLAENHDEAIKRVSFSEVPGHIVKDLLVAISRNKKESKAAVGAVKGKDFDTMRVSELRMELSELGLDVDGSREAMIEALRKSAQPS